MTTFSHNPLIHFSVLDWATLLILFDNFHVDLIFWFFWTFLFTSTVKGVIVWLFVFEDIICSKLLFFQKFEMIKNVILSAMQWDFCAGKTRVQGRVEWRSHNFDEWRQAERLAAVASQTSPNFLAKRPLRLLRFACCCCD